jgi:hypothetical protein
LIKLKTTPRPWWKFAIKAAYIRANLLAGVMEFKTPKNLLQNFALPTLEKLLNHFYPELQGDQSVIS